MFETLMEKKAATVIEVIRPAIQADNGDVFLPHVDVETVTLKDGIERILQDRIDALTVVEHTGAELAGASLGAGAPACIGSTIVSPLRPPAASR